MSNRQFTLVGAAVGLACFLAVGLLPSLVYGGYAGVMLATGLFGSPLQATVLVRLLLVFTMVLGVLSIGSLFTIAGSVVGAAVSYLLGGRRAASPVHCL